MINKIIIGFIIFSSAASIARPTKVDYEQDFNSLLTLGVKGGYSLGNLFGDGTVPTFTGALYGGEIEYIFGRGYFSVAPFAEYRWMRLQNNANTVTDTDTWEQSYWGGGVRIYTSRAFFKAGYGSSTITESIAISAATTSYASKSKSLVLGAGMNWIMPPFFRIELGLDMMHTKVAQAEGTFPSRRDLFNYTGYLALKFILDSGYARPAEKE